MKIHEFIIFILANCFFVGSVFSQDEAFFLGTASGVGGRALSMGSAYVAMSDDYSATLWNPAGLTQLRRMELFTSLSNLQYASEAINDNISNVDKTTKTRLNSIGFAFPIPTYRGSMVFAVGYNRVRNFDAGFSFTWFNDLANKRNFTKFEEGGLANYVLAGAVEVTPHLSVGATLNIWRGEDNYNESFSGEKVYLGSDIGFYNNAYYKELNDNYQINTKFRAANFKLGALYTLGILGRIGATIATPLTLEGDLSWSFGYNGITASDSTDDDSYWGETSYKLRSPYVFSVGAAFTLLPNIVLTADAEYTDWSQTRYEDPPYEGQTEIDENLRFKNEFRATTTYRLGAEFTVPLINTQLRAGMIQQPSPLNTASEKSDRNYLTAGVGFLLDKQVKVDFAWVHGWWENDDANLPADLPEGSVEKITIDKYFATLSIRF